MSMRIKQEILFQYQKQLTHYNNIIHTNIYENEYIHCKGYFFRKTFFAYINMAVLDRADLEMNQKP